MADTIDLQIVTPSGVALTGPPGSGKTRLALEMERVAKLREPTARATYVATPSDPWEAADLVIVDVFDGVAPKLEATVRAARGVASRTLVIVVTRELDDALRAIVDEEIALGADDYELVEEERDDEVTPRKDLPPVTGARDHGEPDMESLLMFATVGVKDWSAPRSAPLQADPPTPETPKIEASRADPPKAEAPKSDAPRADPPKAEAPKPEAKAVATSAAKSRVAELAAQMRAKKEAAKAKVDDLDLDHLLDAAPGADASGDEVAPVDAPPADVAADVEDAAVDASGVPSATPAEGCVCAAGTPARAPTAAWLAWAALLARRRRRR
jgi:hypothetical protein